MVDDAELLRRFATAGADDAFRELVQRRFGLVYAVALRQVGGDAHLARDVAQCVFIALARQATALSERAVITSWLFRATRYTAIDVIRAERRRRVREYEAHIMQETHVSGEPASVADWQALRPFLDEALSELDERDRDAVMLRIFEARRFDEIGSVLRVTEDAARMRFDRALEKLRRRLRRHGVTSTTSALMLALGHQALAAPPAGLAATVAGVALTSAKVASVAATSGAALTLMSTSKFVSAAAGVLAAVALGVGTFSAREGREANDSAVPLEREIESLIQRGGALRSQISNSAPRTSAATTITPARAAEPTGPAGSSSLVAQAAAIRANYEARQRMRADPAFQQVSIQATRVSTRIDYAPLFRALRFTPEQIKIFENLIAERAWSGLDVTAARIGLGLPHNDPAVLQEVKRQEEDFHARLRERLGDGAIEEFLRYETSAPLRDLTSHLAANLYHTENPLTAAQADQLSEIVSRHIPNLENLDQRWRTDPSKARAILREAQVVLSPVQVRALTAQFANQRWVVESVWELNRPAVPAP